MSVHDTPSNVRRLSLHRDLPLPLSISLLTTSDAPPDRAPSTIAPEKVLGPDDGLGAGGRVGDDDLDGMEGVVAEVGLGEGAAGDDLVRAEDTALRGGDGDTGRETTSALRA